MSGGLLACRRMEYLIYAANDERPELGLHALGYDACGDVADDWQPFMLYLHGRALTTLWVSRLDVVGTHGYMFAHARETPIPIRDLIGVIATAVQNRF